MPTGVALLTGGAGYIGSHTAVELLCAGWDVVVVDDFSNASPVALERVARIAADHPGAGRLRHHRLDVTDTPALTRVLAEEGVDAVVHFAGLKAVGESVEQPLRYYRVNVGGATSLLEAMAATGVHRLVFSSSATVYGEPATVPVDESAPLGATNPYGRTKLTIEHVMRDVATADERSRFVALRYFNPVGAHPSGLIGEDPEGVPNNLMPYIMQVAVGRRPHIRVFGDDYPTPDGTGVRDYIHVVDLALGHLAALEALDRLDPFTAVNLGTGRGSSVLEVIDAASRAVGRALPYEVVGRRPGDVAAIWADPSLAHELLGWKATRTLDDMAADHWRWQSRNPHGYRGAAGAPEGEDHRAGG
ncbi:MAG TPA: UDP-glucose 4-epimerase GalE [Acidimicrobiales bacterium]|nr:UDP-glucose 4-epimerase GalE [Acidimicrobiales bacterium]